MYKNAAIIPSKGIGDVFLMLVAANNLFLNNYNVIIFSKSLSTLEDWFPKFKFKNKDEILNFDLDLVIIQHDDNDNLKKIESIKKRFKNISIFYINHNKEKHPPLSKLDKNFSRNHSSKNPRIVENIATSTASLLNSTKIFYENGMVIPPNLIKSKFKNRIIISPTTSTISKNWGLKNFIKTALILKKNGFTPVFTTSYIDLSQKDLLSIKNNNIEIRNCKSLTSFATMIYESAGVLTNDSLAGHISSNMNIDTFIVAYSHKHMKTWEPGWKKAKIFTPPKWIPNVKMLRFREKFWKNFISCKKIATTIANNFNKIYF